MGEPRIYTRDEALALTAGATPGPWRITDSDSIAPHVGAEWPLVYVMGDVDGRPWLDEWELAEPLPLADAALIAAAPDLAASVAYHAGRADGAAAEIADAWQALAEWDVEACANLRRQLLAMTAERDRLARVLAVERGDQTQAPAGWCYDDDMWLHDGPDDSGCDEKLERDPTGGWTRLGVTLGRRAHYDLALEAMEAIAAGVPNG